RALNKGEVDAARVAVSTSGKGLLIAMLTTVIGLGSLLVAEVPPVRQFGAVASISVISNMLICVTFIPAFLSKFDPGFDKCDIASPGEEQIECPPRLGIEEGFYRFTKLMTVKPYVTLFFVAILVSGGMYGFANVEPETEMMNFWPSGLQEFRDIEQLKSEVESPKVITMTANTEGLYEPEQFEKLHHMQMMLADDPKINTVDSITEMVLFMNNGKLPATKSELESIFNQMPPEVKARYISESGDKLAVDYYIDDISGKATSDIISKIESSEKYVDLGADSALTITGSPVLNRNIILNVTSGLTTMTATSFVLGFLFLLIAYRNFRTPLALMLTIVTALFWVGGAMY
ncbi:MAG: MMPL family transporter, partial [Methanosarcinales archaeon]|nr:MMPL family transporter [Methanosarcinales archaeon]